MVATLGGMKGWTPRGDLIELTKWQEDAVRQLLGPHPIAIVNRGRQFGWSTVLETAHRYDRSGTLPPRDEPPPG